ncbi:hypothetical protein [Faecalispora jeddahensis]|uniref:hypothetical protein n=1 Tax=Faecalispora jeddahensis TaxID=1414721 RepID=UPI001D5F017E|nr:hypothetical protein [Faecalispora jeddahensis]MBE6743421.1 hypothetical protein [Oscillospiraceae bacterium]
MSELYHKVIQKPWGRSKADRGIFYPYPKFYLWLWCSALPENEIDIVHSLENRLVFKLRGIPPQRTIGVLIDYERQQTARNAGAAWFSVRFKTVSF